MKAFVLDKYGKESSMSFREVADPILRDDEVLVKVCAAGVNQLDVKIRNGDFKLILPYSLPFILGHDVAGIVEHVGSRVRQFVPGDKVYARLDDFRIGAFAEYAAIKESSIALIPETLSMKEAASVPLAALTALAGIGRKSRAQKGAEGIHTSRFRGCRNIRHSACETYRGFRRDDDEQGERRFRKRARRRSGDRLQDR